jgi:hypothetical protein
MVSSPCHFLDGSQYLILATKLVQSTQTKNTCGAAISENDVQARPQASCSCGQLSAQVVGDPVRVSICHCLACQRRTGSVFGQQARFRRESVTLACTSSVYVRIGDEGSHITFHFCPHCSSTVYYQPEGMEEFLAIPVGAFADPRFPTPSVSVYEERMHAWVVPPVDAEHIF